jgi:diamine N-acetyltransferase
MGNVKIQKPTSDQMAQLQAIARQTFRETFAEHNTEENMRQYLEEGFSLEKMTAEINNPHSEFYFAAQEEQVIGYLKVNFGPAQTEIKNDNAMEIERIYVLQEFHGKNIGQMLYEKAIQVAQAAKVEYVWLGVWEKNQRALRFYQKNGFTAFDKHIFVLGDDAQTDIMMKQVL